MTFEIIWDQQPKDFLKKIEEKEAQRIIKKVNNIDENPMHYLETLVDINAFKLRVGDHRVLIDVNQEARTITILFIGHRKNIYKNLKKTNF